MTDESETWAEISRESRARSRRRDTIKGLLAGLAVLAVLAGITLWYLDDAERDRERNREQLVERYCGYDTEVSARVRRCVRTTTVEEITRLYDEGDEAAGWAIDQGSLNESAQEESLSP